MMTKCADIMTRKIKYHEPGATVDSVARTMKDQNVGPVPIVDSAEAMHLIGIVTDRDLTVKVLAANKVARQTRVEEVMTGDPVACFPMDDIERALSLMEEHQIRRIPVVDETQRLIGIIAQADIATRLKQPKSTATVVERVSQRAH